MFAPVLIEKFALPILDWVTAFASATGHVLAGTLFTDSTTTPASDSE